MNKSATEQKLIEAAKEYFAQGGAYVDLLGIIAGSRAEMLGLPIQAIQEQYVTRRPT